MVHLRFTLRRTLTLHSGNIGDNPKYRVPWTRVTDSPDDYFDAKFLPDGVRLREPSRMTEDTITKIISHWNSRRDMEGEEVFLFHHWVKPNGVEREAAVYHPPSIETGKSRSTAKKRTRTRTTKGKGKAKEGNGKAKERKGKGKGRATEGDSDTEGEVIDIPSFSNVPEEDDDGSNVGEPDGGNDEDEESTSANEPTIERDSPADIANTREAKVKFLKSLVHENVTKYHQLVDWYAQMKVNNMLSVFGYANKSYQLPGDGTYKLAELDGMEWATWDRPTYFGPEELHTEEDVMEKIIALLRSDDYLDDTGTVTTDIGLVEKYLLCVGLFSRDLYKHWFGKEDDPMPNWIRSSSHDFEATDDLIVEFLTKMHSDLPPDLGELDPNFHGSPDKLLQAMAGYTGYTDPFLDIPQAGSSGLSIAEKAQQLDLTAPQPQPSSQVEKETFAEPLVTQPTITPTSVTPTTLPSQPSAKARTPQRSPQVLTTSATSLRPSTSGEPQVLKESARTTTSSKAVGKTSDKVQPSVESTTSLPSSTSPKGDGTSTSPNDAGPQPKASRPRPKPAYGSANAAKRTSPVEDAPTPGPATKVSYAYFASSSR